MSTDFFVLWQDVDALSETFYEKLFKSLTLLYVFSLNFKNIKEKKIIF